MPDDLAAKREEIRKLDASMLDLARRRLELAREIGAMKRERGLPLRNYEIEAEVIDEARRVARIVGLEPAWATDLVKLLIRESVRLQEVDGAGARAAAPRGAERALVIGGAGNMGAWFARYLSSRGMAVAVSDLRGPLEGYEFVADWAARAGDFDVVVVATPPSAVGAVLSRLAASPPRGLLVEIASLKSPIVKEVEDAVAAGARVASLHPMWGHRTDLLAAKNLVVCDAGDRDAAAAARALFADTAANVVDVPLRAHDAFMAFTLGMPHALNLAFAHALRDADVAHADLERLGGPTFNAQARLAREVSRENKDLYWEIQRLNDHTPDVFRRVRKALDDLEGAVASRDAFHSFMRECEAYWGDS